MEQRLTAQLRTKNQRRRAALATSHAAASAVRHRNDLLPKLQLVDRNIDDLSAPARNVRTADPAHVREIANAIAALRRLSSTTQRGGTRERFRCASGQEVGSSILPGSTRQSRAK